MPKVKEFFRRVMGRWAQIKGTTRGPAKATPPTSQNRLPKEKSVSIVKLVSFWRDYDKGLRRSKNRKPENEKGKQPWFDQLGVKKTMQPVAVTRTVIGNVRVFKQKRDLATHLLLVRKLNNIGRHTRFKYFEFQPARILSIDIPRHRILERAYRAPSVYDLVKSAERGESLQHYSLYGDYFIRKMKKRRIPMEEVVRALYDVEGEVEQLFKDIPKFDWHSSIVLVLDVDPVTKKPLIAFVDHGPRPRKSLNEVFNFKK